ncbi:hypothetical protein BGZ96_012280 [Linnemannia gamsii]|uniref:Uncharacterized protein n=1 Tax=Linnemannia gamsii TaxID=64522 RepID=A0ABQ7JQP2_9FUNG|nr:hypothetical protein BGZ96_012280 [Linnemannia gamsii]
MISKPRSIKGPWTPEEDRQLRMLVNELGAEKWVLIASRLGSRTGKQCRERWHNHLDPKIDKSPFTAKEDELIFKLFAQFGSKWAEMSKMMPGRPDNAIKNHFNTSMQRKRRRLSLQDPSELQMKGEHGPSNGAVSPPLASPTSATSPSVTRHNRFDPYERRHSMPSLEFSPKAYNHHHHPHHHHSGSRDYSGEIAAGGHPYHQPPPPPHHNGHHHLPQQQQPQHPHQQQQQQQHPNGPGQGPYPRTIPTPPKTPDTKGPLKFAASMSRSISLGSSDRMGMPAPGGNANGGHHHQHSHSLSHNGPVRPNLPGISSLHSPPPPPHSGSNNHGHHLYNTSTMAAIVPPSSSTTASLTSPSSSSTPPSAVLMARSSSAMGISNESPSTFYNRNPRDAPFNPNQQQQQQSMRPGFPRPNNNLARHDSAGGSSGRFVRGHEHHRSLDIDPFSALAELANLADQQRQAPGSGSPTSSSNINKSVATTSSNHHGATTVVVQSSEENDEYNSHQHRHQHHQRRGSQGGSGGESMSRSGSGSSIDGPDVEDVEDAVIKTMIERPLVHTPAPTQGPPAPGPLARRFSTLGHVKEEEHGEEAEEQQQHQHSYHIDPRINNTNNGPTQGTLGHSKSYSGHTLSNSRDLSSSMTTYRSKRLSVDFSILSDPASDGDEDDEGMVVDGADGGAHYYHQQQSHYNQQQYQQQQQYRYPANKQQEGSSSSSPTSPGPSAAYLSMRRGSVRELMAIDHLCLSSEEVERC